MIEGKLSNGFEYSIEKDSFDDWELLEILERIDEGDQKLIVKAFPMILGERQFASLKEHIRNAKGRVSIVEMVSCFSEIMDSNAKKL